MLENRDPAHYLKTVATTSTPKRLLWLDCATTASKEQGLFVDRWAGGALGSTHYTSRKSVRKDTLADYDTPQQLWAAADAFCIAGRRVVLWGYDLATQMRISQALIVLPMMGWHLDKIVLERTSAWARFVDGRRTLLMCDLKAWAPVDFNKFATDIITTEPDMSPECVEVMSDRGSAQWRVTIIRESVLQILHWIEAENLGPFRPTGSGQSYAAFRRRFMHHSLLVHDDVPRLQAERTAMYTGRCEAWKHGQLTGGPFVEYDLHAAYCTIARDCEVPTIAGREHREPRTTQLAKLIETHAVLADVTVTTRVPCVPTRMGGRTVWPVGTFRSWLWDPELTLAIRYADRFECHTAYQYTRGPALQTFGQYVLDGMGPQSQVYGLVPKRVLKHWSRCLVGRLGLRYRSWVKFGTCDEPDVRLVTYIDVDEGTSTDLLCAGYDRFLLADMCESLDSLPQIPSWVMSKCRAMLWDTMTFVGWGDVVYVDTDSIIVNGSAKQWSLVTHDALRNYGWVAKSTYSRMVLHGPRNYTADNSRVVAGLPKTARQTAPLEFTGHVMRSIKESMRAGQLDCVATIPRKFVLHAPDLRRQHLDNNNTAPYEVQLPTMEDD